MHSAAARRLAVGIDVGTSGVRALALGPDGREQARAAVPLAPARRVGASVTQAPQAWAEAVDACIAALNTQLDPAQVGAVAFDGTSGTLLVCDDDGIPQADARLYHDAGCVAEGERVNAAAPPGHVARGAASGLARLLHLGAQAPGATHALHQADWLAGRLLGRWDLSDENNALKTGYDPQARAWPAWVRRLLAEAGLPDALLPAVHPPGTPLGSLCEAAATRTGWPRDCLVAAGTTDGVAAFLATGACTPGEGVTSLGSTLVVKQLARAPLSAPAWGVYSHRLGELWLPGGASNAGGAVLLQHFSPERLAALEPLLRPDEPTGLDYYPLPAPGERFPIADPSFAGRIEPRPGDDLRFLQGLLEGLAAVEALAYARLRELGAPALTRLYSVGGGARNRAFARIRARALGVPLADPAHEEAAAGAARLARQALQSTRGRG
ncbi:FGGY-family carbohydrate kinase [Piscinibacter defluvii]|uniref:FGGY-family carbohydrate kinase n=1 Tax=Piscinibacter defluvii TaxID=1796922 RepID=UPI000FDDA847|nr:FGGY-family carbohydrate kinase [Piscinibacter defluvii]